MKYTIIGAGIGGLTTALAFEQKGIDYQIIEKAPKFKSVGAGIWLAPNALQVYNTLGLLDELQKKGHSIHRITLADERFRSLSDLDQQHVKSMFGYTTIAIHRAELHQLLVDRIPHHKLKLAKGFHSFKKLPNSKIELLFEDQSTCQTDYLIGADGINSIVRQQLFPSSKVRTSGQTCWRGLANIKLTDELKHRAFELWGKQIRFGASPVQEGLVYWFAVANKNNSIFQKTEQSPELLESLFKEFHPIVSQLISTTPHDKRIKNDINDLTPLRKWHNNQICLIGDAGHATTPNMGQGGAQAIEDAYYLSNLINQYPATNIFTLFQEKREKKVNAIVKQSLQTGNIAHWKYGRKIRNSFIRAIPSKWMERALSDLYQIERFS